MSVFIFLAPFLCPLPVLVFEKFLAEHNNYFSSFRMTNPTAATRQQCVFKDPTPPRTTVRAVRALNWCQTNVVHRKHELAFLRTLAYLVLGPSSPLGARASSYHSFHPGFCLLQGQRKNVLELTASQLSCGAGHGNVSGGTDVIRCPLSHEVQGRQTKSSSTGQSC